MANRLFDDSVLETKSSAFDVVNVPQTGKEIDRKVILAELLGKAVAAVNGHELECMANSSAGHHVHYFFFVEKIVLFIKVKWIYATFSIKRDSAFLI